MNPFRNAWWLVAFVVVVSCRLGELSLALSTTPRTGRHGRDKTNLSSSTGGEDSTMSGKDRKNAQPNLVRGEHYKTEASTLPSPQQIAKQLGVKPTKEASNKTWKRAWTWHKRMIPLLHSTDGCKPPDSSLNLACMWWKGLAGNDKSSPVCDDGLAYDLLPSGWRKIIKPTRLYPRLHHGNVELRTAYLDQQVSKIASNNTNIRLVCMGAGYDTRGIKMIEREIAQEVYELDLPGVVEAKERLFGRLKKRRPWLKDLSMPTLVASDFNELPDLETKLKDVLLDNNKESMHTIFVFEGVMIYLNDGIPSGLLELTSRLLRENQLEGSLCFADRLENVPGGDYDKGVQELDTNGWNLEDWSPKPGLARHMGSASLLSTKKTA